MIHIAIYDRTPAVGLGLSDLSPQFPEEYYRQIQRLSEGFGTPEDPGILQQNALRYTPMGDKYLLCLVQRLSDGRRYNRIVHYLMDRQEAEMMLQWDLRSLMDRLAEVADSNAAAQQEFFRRSDWAAGLSAPHTKLKDETLRHALLVGASLSDITKKIRVVLPKGDDYPLKFTGWLLAQLPPALRIRVRFNTDVSIPSEGNGCCLLFCTPEANSLFQRGVSGGELADVCVYYPQEGCDRSMLQREFAFVQPLLEAPAPVRQNALLLFGEDGDWEKYLDLLCVPYQNPREDLKTLAAICGSTSVAVHLGELGYAPKSLESLARNAPGWLRDDPALYQAVKKYHKTPDTPLKAAAAEPVFLRSTAEPEPICAPVKRMKREPVKVNPAACIAVLLCVLVLVLLAVSVKLLTGGLEVSEQPVVLVITASARHYLLRSAGLAVSCTALGAALVLAVQNLYRFMRRRNKEDQS